MYSHYKKVFLNEKITFYEGNIFYGIDAFTVRDNPLKGGKKKNINRV